MFRPVGGSGGRLSTLAYLVLSGAFALICVGPAQAASSVVAQVPQKLIQLAEGGTYGPEQRAQELYLDAIGKLDAGHDSWAQKTFEALIAQFPQTTAADRARQQLGLLYRHGAGPQNPSLAGAEPVKAAVPAAPLPASRTVGATTAWEQELRRNGPIQARLRNEAGDRVFFSAGSAELGSRARAALSAQAQWLNRWHEFEAAIEGHADEPGGEDENQKLSAARAEAVRRRLIEEGVESSRLAIVAQGRMQRIATCAGGDCAAQNRRAVTLVFVGGTRERLGLTTPAPLQALAGPQPAAATTQTEPAAERVGVAR